MNQDHVEELEDILANAENLVVTMTGKHLDDLQMGIVRGVLSGKRYIDIAEEFHCSAGHVKDVGYELWRVLSEAVGEKVTRKNLRSVMQRNRNQFTGNTIDNRVRNGNVGNIGIGNTYINLCRTSPTSSNDCLQLGGYTIPSQISSDQLIEKLRSRGWDDKVIAALLSEESTI